MHKYYKQNIKDKCASVHIDPVSKQISCLSLSSFAHLIHWDNSSCTYKSVWDDLYQRWKVSLCIIHMAILLPPTLFFTCVFAWCSTILVMCGAGDPAAARGELLLCQVQVCGFVGTAWSSQGNSHKARSTREEGSFLQAGFAGPGNLHFILQRGDSDAVQKLSSRTITSKKGFPFCLLWKMELVCLLIQLLTRNWQLYFLSENSDVVFPFIVQAPIYQV